MSSSRPAPDCLIYARMSTNDIRRARQLAHGDQGRLAEIVAEKVAAQLAETREYAAGEGWTVLEHFADNMISGAARYRKATQQPVERARMLAAVAARPGRPVVVLVTEVARLYRDTDESRELVRLARTCPVTVATVDDERYDLTTVEGESGFEAVVSRAARESGTVSRRRRRKEARRAAEGGYWGTEPFGYHKVFDTDPETGQRYYTGALVLCDESCPGLNGCMNSKAAATDETDTLELGGLGEAELIAVAALRLTGGATLRSIVVDWHQLGITTRNGEVWTQPMLKALLLNKRLNGIRVHRAGDKWGRADRKAPGTETPGNWPKILDDDLAMAVRGVLLDPERSRYTRTNVRRHLLAGIAVCGRCGATMKGHPQPRKVDGSTDRQYQCPPPPDGCGRARRSTDTADKWVIQHLLYWTRPDGPYAQYVARERAALAESQSARTAELAELAAQDERAARSLAGYQGRLDAGIEDPAALDAVLAAVAALGKTRDRRAARAAELRAEIPPAELQPGDWESLRDDLRHGDIVVRSELVKRFVDRVIIHPPGQGTRLVFDERTVEVVPGPWAHGLEPASLAVPVTDTRYSRHYSEIAAQYVAAHPGATAKEVADGTGRSWSTACTMLKKLVDAGAVTAIKHGRSLRYSSV